MPSAGGVVPPVIVPLRQAIVGRASNHLDTCTYIELQSESPGSKVYFSTDGSKPNPFQRKIAGREITFRYRAPFTLKAGKRTLKTVAVVGDKESNVVTKTFTVDDVGPPNDDDDASIFSAGFDTESELETTRLSTRPGSAKLTRPGSAKAGRKKNGLRKSASLTKIGNTEPKEAWVHTNGVSNGYDDVPGVHQNHVQVPKGPFNPVNYSGTQLNLWGVAPGNLPSAITNGVSRPYNDRASQLGYMTQNMLRNLHEPQLTAADVRRMLEEQRKREQPQPEPVPAIEYVEKEPDAKKESPGNGDWRGQLKHIYAHLLQHCQNNVKFRTAIAEPKMGKVAIAEFDEEEGSFTLTVTLGRPGYPAPVKPKIKPKVKTEAKVERTVKKPAPPPEKPKEKPKEPPPKPKPKAKPKEEKPKEDPYFETEEYEKAKPSHPSRRRSTLSPSGRRPSRRSEDSSSGQKSIRRKKRPYPVRRPKEPSPASSDTETESLADSEEEEAELPPLMRTDPYFLTEEYEQEGTLKPYEHFDAERDSEVIRKAMKGLGTDEAAILNILGYRSSPQRVELVKMFKTMFGKDLKGELNSELSGDFLETCLALCSAAAEYDASEINKAVKGLGTDDDALIEILCTRTNKQIIAIRETYKKLFSKDMEKDVKDDTSGHFKRLLVSQIQANRDESPTFDRTKAKQDAQSLYEAGENKWGTDESTFNLILCQRSFPHLRAVFEEYAKLSKKDMEEVIKSEFSGDIKNGLLTVVRCIKNKPLYFARKMQKAMKGLGTDDSALIRVVVSRCECDMVQIKEAFQKEFKGTLAEWIADDTSGDYKEILLALIGDRAAPPPTAEELEDQGEPEIEEIEEVEVVEEGTVKPADPFDALADAGVLRKAMKGFGTDEDAIINCLSARSNEQRQEIVKSFKTAYGKDLIKELKSELSGNLCDTVIGLCQTSPQFDANQLRKAMKGLGTDEDALIEVICTRSSQEMATIVQTYKQLFSRNLEEDIISETSGNLKRLLVSMVQANRPEGNTIDRRKCRKDAKDLLEAGENKWGTDESRFNVILCSRSFAHLRVVFEEYQKAAGKDIEESIKSEMSGDIKKGMLTIVRCVRSKAEQFAKTLYDSMSGLGTNDDMLIRVVVSRCEVDMVQIKEIFQKNYKQPLGQFVAGDISGDYRKIILALIGEPNVKK